MELKSSQKQQLLETEISPLIQQFFFFRKKEFLVGASSVIAGIIILIAYFQSGPTARAYASAEIAYSNWEAAPEDEELYQKMKEAIRKVPALERKYEAFIAQRLLDGEKTSEAIQLANHSLNRIKQDTPFHASYALASLMIEQGAYEEALDKALQLKDQMEHFFDLSSLTGDRLVGGSVLYAHNLLRIACLLHQLQNRAGEKAAWEEFENFIKKKNPASDLVLGSFSDKQIDLNSFITERKKNL